MNIDGRTVLITGGAGFIGSHIADTLVGSNEVRVLDDLSTGSRDNVPSEAELLEGSVCDRDTLETAMADVDLVFHEAAMVSVPESIERPRRCHDVNGTATIDVLEEARLNDSRVVIASSAAIYGRPESLPVTEAEPKRPSSPYGAEKLSADNYVRVYADRYGIETVALRYFNVYGPRQRGGQYSGVISAFTDQAKSGGPITVHGNGEQTRDFVYVDDVVRANLLAATTDATGKGYNVATGTSISIRELAETVRSLVDDDVDIVHTDPRPGDIERSEADVTKARERLGFEPTVSLRDGLSTLV